MCDGVCPQVPQRPQVHPGRGVKSVNCAGHGRGFTKRAAAESRGGSCDASRHHESPAVPSTKQTPPSPPLVVCIKLNACTTILVAGGFLLAAPLISSYSMFKNTLLPLPDGCFCSTIPEPVQFCPCGCARVFLVLFASFLWFKLFLWVCQGTG